MDAARQFLQNGPVGSWFDVSEEYPSFDGSLQEHLRLDARAILLKVFSTVVGSPRVGSARPFRPRSVPR